MHTPLLRLNVIFFYSLSALFCAAIACALLSYFIIAAPNNQPKITYEITNAQVNRFRVYNRPAPQFEHAHTSFHLDADLRPLWNWNVQQLFVYVSAEWKGKSRRRNRAVLWDRIIRNVNDSYINQDIDSEYTLACEHRELRNKLMNLTLHWDIQPVVGMIQAGGGIHRSGHTLQMPATYA